MSVKPARKRGKAREEAAPAAAYRLEAPGGLSVGAGRTSAPAGTSPR